MITRNDLMSMSRPELMAVLEAGHPIDPAELDDTEYRGVSLGLPDIVDRIAWKTFKKVFHRDPTTGALRGWNVRIVQDGVDGSYEPVVVGDEPKTFGHYEVVATEGYKMPCRCDGLLIDYGLGKNGRLDPMHRMRDPIVAVNAGSAELLLGWSYVDLGLGRVGTPSFFTLSRDGALTHRADPPRR